MVLATIMILIVTSGDLLQLNYGTLYPALLKLEQEGFIRSRWGTSENKAPYKNRISYAHDGR
jgi:DNA-binding PadR family transcriptional regulator